MSDIEDDGVNQSAESGENPTSAQGAESVDVAKLQAELADAKDRMLRAMAEVENVRRRLEREKDDTARYAISRFAKDLLSVADNLQRALEAVPAGALDGNEFLAKLVDGVSATERALTSVFERNGLKRFESADRPFDPNFHEVLFEMDAPGKPAGTIVQVLENGYTLGDRLLRPARVGVARATSNG